MNEISNNNLMNNNIKNDNSSQLLNTSKYDNNIYLEKNFSTNPKFSNDLISINSKLREDEINNSNNSIDKISSSFNKIFPYSSIESFNHSILNLSKVDKPRRNNNKKEEKIKLHKNYITNNEENYYLHNKNHIDNKNKNSIFKNNNYSAFNLKHSILTKKIMNDNKKLNKLYNYGESLTQKT